MRVNLVAWYDGTTNPVVILEENHVITVEADHRITFFDKKTGKEVNSFYALSSTIDRFEAFLEDYGLPWPTHKLMYCLLYWCDWEG